MNKKHNLHIIIQVEEDPELDKDIHDLCEHHKLFGFTHDFIRESIEHGAVMTALRNGSAEIHHEG